MAMHETAIQAVSKTPTEKDHSMPDNFSPFDDDRYLIIDDTDEDMTQLITVISDHGHRPACLDTRDFGGAS